MTQDLLKLWMPISKSHDGGFVGILSDTSLDRDDEFMTKELLKSWADNVTPLPMLANHENKLEKLIGGWTDKKLVVKGDSAALVARPFFLESNPLGLQAKNMVQEALDKGLQIGISIGAIPQGEMVEKEIDGKRRKGYQKAEILEATIVPIQSNRNASFFALAKSFDITLPKSEAVPCEQLEKEVQQEVLIMVEEIKKEETIVQESAPEVVEKQVEQQSEVEKSLLVENEALKKELADLKTKSVNLPTVERMEVKEQSEFLPTIENIIRRNLGLKK